MELLNASLAAGGSTDVVVCQGERLLFTVSGDLDGETLTLYVAPAKATFGVYVTPDASGTDAAITVGDAALTLGNVSRVFYAMGQRLKWTCSSGGGTPSGLNVYVDGDAFTIER